MISVIIPVYNVEKYIGECIKSLLSQTYRDFEIILVNDGSPDMSGQICDQYALIDTRIKVIHQENKGVSAARNAGIQHAAGNYFCFIDADDYVDEEYLRILQDLMIPGGMAVCNIWEDNDNNKLYTDISDRMTAEEAQISAFSGYGIKGYVWGKLYDAELIRNNDLTFECRLSICEDLLFVIQYLKYVSSYVVWNHSTLYYYREVQNGAVKKRFRRHEDFSIDELTEITALDYCRQYLYATEEIEKAYEARTVKAAANTLRAMVANLYWEPVLRKRMMRLVRKSVLRCIRTPYLVFSSKVSICVSSISPELEFWIWKLLNQNSEIGIIKRKKD